MSLDTKHLNDLFSVLTKKYKGPNLECLTEGELFAESPMRFGLNLTSKPSFRFTLQTDENIIKLCSPTFFMVKEIVRRTGLSAIPVVRYTPGQTSNATAWQQVLNIFDNNNSDIDFGETDLDSERFYDVGISQSMGIFYQINIIGTFYKISHYIDVKAFEAFQTFDVWFWTLLLISTIILTFTLVFYKTQKKKLEREKLFFRVRNRNKLKTWMQLINQFGSLCAIFTVTPNSAKIKSKNVCSGLLITLVFLSFLVQQFFQSNMTNLLMFPSHKTIESLSDLLSHPQIKPISLLSPGLIRQIKKYGTAEELKLLNSFDKTQNLTRNDIAKGAAANQVLQEKSHVYVMDELMASTMVRYINENLELEGFERLHKSSLGFLSTSKALVYRRNIGSKLRTVFKEVNIAVFETGCYYNWVGQMRKFAAWFGKLNRKSFRMNFQKNLKETSWEVKFTESIRQIFIAVRPGQVGSVISLFVLFAEIIHKWCD